MQLSVFQEICDNLRYLVEMPSKPVSGLIAVEKTILKSSKSIILVIRKELRTDLINIEWWKGLAGKPATVEGLRFVKKLLIALG